MDWLPDVERIYDPSGIIVALTTRKEISRQAFEYVYPKIVILVIQI